MRTRTYEAALSAASVARVVAARRSIEEKRGKVLIAPSGTSGMTIVVLTLPEQFTPEMFVPGLPFYPTL